MNFPQRIRKNIQKKFQLSAENDFIDAVIVEIRSSSLPKNYTLLCTFEENDRTMMDTGYLLSCMLYEGDLVERNAKEIGLSFSNLLRYSHGEEPKKHEFLDSYVRRLRNNIFWRYPDIMAMIYHPMLQSAEEIPIKYVYLSNGK